MRPHDAAFRPISPARHDEPARRPETEAELFARRARALERDRRRGGRGLARLLHLR